MEIRLNSHLVQIHQPVFVFVTGADLPNELNVRVRQVTGEGAPMDPFTRPLNTNNQGFEGSFSLSMPGTYEVQVGLLTSQVKVTPAEQLSFEREFGILSVFVTLGLLGLILWARRRRQKQNV